MEANMTTAETVPAQPDLGPTSADRNVATLSHLSAFVMFLGIPAVVGPLVMWLINRDKPFIEPQAREALNFNLSFLLYGVVAGFLIIFLIGLLLLPAVFVTWFVLVLVAAVKTSNGESYRYPMTLRFVS